MKKIKPLFNLLQDYNPKLDYLICKNIVSNFPEKYEEIHVRNCYYGLEPCKNESEKNMYRLKTFLQENNLIKFTSHQLKSFHKDLLITTKPVNLKFFDELLLSNYTLLESVIQLFTKWNQSNSPTKQDISFRLMFVTLCLQKEGNLVVPYSNAIDKIKEQVQNSVDKQTIKESLDRLYFRTQEINVKHALEINHFIRNNLEKNKERFKREIQAKSLGLIGSFALNQENEYSDVDLVIFMEKDFEETEIKQKAYHFWKEFIPIKLDIVVVKEGELSERMTPSMLKTLKII